MFNLAGGETGFDTQETKLPTNWNTSFSKICLGMKIGQQIKFVVIPGEGHSTRFYTGRLRPEVQPLTLLHTIFDREGTPFVYPPLKNGTPFTYLLKNAASLF